MADSFHLTGLCLCFIIQVLSPVEQPAREHILAHYTEDFRNSWGGLDGFRPGCHLGGKDGLRIHSIGRRGIISMNNIHDRILRFTGAPYEIGFAAGRALGVKIEETISHYIAGLENFRDIEKLHAGALPWLRRLPQRFQEEYEGIAEGANLSLQRLAEWSYIEECETKERQMKLFFSIVCARNTIGVN